MPKLKHLAIRTEDTGKLATFYMDVFEMQMLNKPAETRHERGGGPSA